MAGTAKPLFEGLQTSAEKLVELQLSSSVEPIHSSIYSAVGTNSNFG
jgi:hypothetical protein